MKILFVCKYNVFRSRTAEAYFKKINKNKKIRVASAGPINGSGHNCSENQLKALREEGIKFISRPKGLTLKMLLKQDLIIIVADDVPKSLFDNKNIVKKVVQWKIPDVLDNNKKKSHETIQKIKKNVEKLAKELGGRK